MMIKKDFVAVAKILKARLSTLDCDDRRDTYYQEQKHSEMVEEFVELFKKDNPKFNEGIFLKACGVEK